VLEGVRVSELVDLTLADVELSERAGRVIVREGKGGKYGALFFTVTHEHTQ
jgi:site-specific recombinase XerD